MYIDNSTHGYSKHAQTAYAELQHDIKTQTRLIWRGYRTTQAMKDAYSALGDYFTHVHLRIYTPQHVLHMTYNIYRYGCVVDKWIVSYPKPHFVGYGKPSKIQTSIYLVNFMPYDKGGK